MLSPWNAVPDDFDLEDYLERYADFIVSDPYGLAGQWGSVGAGTVFHEVHLDLGCGKGISTVAYANDKPDVLIVGMDVDRICIAVSAWRAAQAGVRNVVFAQIPDDSLAGFFDPGELSTIYLNFPTPHPKGREAHLRLAYFKRLEEYRRLLAPDGELRLRTDNHAFFRYSLGQLEAVGFDMQTVSFDARSELPAGFETDYERRAVEMGATICELIAKVGEESDDVPTSCEGSRTFADAAAALPESLYDYLTDEDLDGDGYVPSEMQRAVTAMRRTRRQKAATEK